MIRFSQGSGLTICLRENMDDSTTVIATCGYGDPCQAKSWTVITNVLGLNELGRVSLELLIANAYAACFNVGYFSTILGKGETLAMKD